MKTSSSSIKFPIVTRKEKSSKIKKTIQTQQGNLESSLITNKNFSLKSKKNNENDIKITKKPHFSDVFRRINFDVTSSNDKKEILFIQNKLQSIKAISAQIKKIEQQKKPLIVDKKRSFSLDDYQFELMKSAKRSLCHDSLRRLGFEMKKISETDKVNKNKVVMFKGRWSETLMKIFPYIPDYLVDEFQKF